MDILSKLNQWSQIPWLDKNILCLHVGGSHLYGTSSKDSDYDFRGVAYAPKDYWIGSKKFQLFECQNDDADIAIHDIRKFLHLISIGSPNVIETLFADKHIYTHNRWPHWCEKARLLLNQNVFQSYHGYSLSQMKKTITKFSNKTGRQDIVQEHGIDTKFISHAFRLIRQGAELLTTGKITFPRPDAENLLDIRNGKVYSNKNIDKCLSDWENENLLLEKARGHSILPPKMDDELENELCIEFYEDIVAN